MAFTGFTNGTRQFLGDLRAHNDRAWFAENRARYDDDVLARQREFVSAIGSRFVALGEPVHAEPAVNPSIFRINRDTRFSRDKSPYKTHADMIFWLGDDKKCCAGYFIRLTGEGVALGGGSHAGYDWMQRAYRAGVADEHLGDELARIIDTLLAEGFVLNAPERKRVPSGFSADHPRAELLKHLDLHALREFAPPPAEFYGPEFVEWCMAQFAQVKPLVDWLAERFREGAPS
jgi:uncharacterized protein (TIGR02453 family)